MTVRTISILNIGHDRDLLSRDRRSEAQQRQLFYCQKLPARIVHLVKAPMDCDRGRLELDAALSVVPCAVRHWVGFVPAAISLGKKLLDAERFDFIQVQEPYLAGVVGAYLSRCYGIPLITGLYSDEIDNPVWLRERVLNRVANRVAKFVLRRAAATRTDSRAVAERVANGGYRNLTYIPFLITHADRLMAMSSNAATLRRELLRDCEGPLLLSVNRLEPEKNIALMLRAFAAALPRRPGMVLAVAGTGRLAERLRQQAELLLPGRVRWLGWVPAEQLADYYQAADLMLISSDRESAARVLYESLLAGTPVISTDTAGAREVVEDGITGRIVPVGDETAFSQRIVELTGDPVFLKSMGVVGRDRMKQTVTADAVVNQLRLFYNQALAQAA